MRDLPKPRKDSPFAVVATVGAVGSDVGGAQYVEMDDVMFHSRVICHLCSLFLLYGGYQFGVNGQCQHSFRSEYLPTDRQKQCAVHTTGIGDAYAAHISADLAQAVGFIREIRCSYHLGGLQRVSR